MFSKRLLGCDVVRRGLATAPNWAEAVEALSYSKNHHQKQNMLDRSRVGETKIIVKVELTTVFFRVF